MITRTYNYNYVTDQYDVFDVETRKMVSVILC